MQRSAPPAARRPVRRRRARRRSAAVAAALALCAAVAGTAGAAPRPSADTVRVSTTPELHAALAAAVPGQTIELADGVYPGNFKVYVSGRPGARIRLTGSPEAVLTARGGNGLHLNGASHWDVTGITISGGQKGIMLDAADHVVIDSVTVHDLDMEGIHFRRSSSHGVVRNSRIHDTGQNMRGMGEGVYVGSARDLGDNSDHVLIENNVIGPWVRGEAVDAKEGTRGGRIIGNTFDGTGLTGNNYDDSWVDIKGNDYLVAGNTGRNTTNDGFQTHSIFPGWGCGTVFRDNHADLTTSRGPDRYAVHVTRYHPQDCPVTVAGSNSVTGGNGLVNPGIPVG